MRALLPHHELTVSSWGGVCQSYPILYKCGVLERVENGVLTACAVIVRTRIMHTRTHTNKKNQRNLNTEMSANRYRRIGLALHGQHLNRFGATSS